MCSKVSTVGIHDVFTYVEDPTGMEPGGYELDQTKLNNQLWQITCITPFLSKEPNSQ